MATLLSVNNYYYRRGGADVIFLEHNRLFEEIGWNVVPFCMKHPMNINTCWSKHFVDEIEFGQPYSTWGKLVRVPKVIYSVEARWKLDYLLDTVRPDVCHAHNIYHHISPAILRVLKHRGVPTVMTLHDLKLVCPAYTMLTHDGVCERCKKMKLYNVLIHRCIKGSLMLSSIVMVESSLHFLIGSYRHNVDRFLVPSRFYIEKIVEWGWDRERLVYMPNFVDVDAYRPNFKAGKAFLYFGRLAPEKGVATFLKAAALARVPVLIAGTGPQESALRQLAESNGANVTFLGYLTGKKLRDAVRSARSTVLPSEWYENAPISVMESYALGTPVIGADIGGITELIREGETGLTFQSGSVEGLAASLRHLSNMPDATLADMGRDARNWIVSEFNSKKYLERLLNLYENLGVDALGLEQVM